MICHFDMKQKINELFEGDVDDTKPSHSNSLCRIVYTFYLANQGIKTSEIAKKMNCCRTLVNKRKVKHAGFYQFDKVYREKIDLIFENEK